MSYLGREVVRHIDMMEGRDERGQINGTRNRVHAQAISNAKREQHQRRILAESPENQPTHKRCTACGELKRIPDDYYMRTRRLQSGLVRQYAPGECKECSLERRRRWIESKTQEELAALNKKWQSDYRKRDPEKWRRQQRESSRAARERAGVTPRGPWKRYRETEVEVFLDAAKVLAYLERFVTLQDTDRQSVSITMINGIEATESDKRLLNLLKHGGQETITASRGDRIATHYNLPAWEILELTVDIHPRS